MRSRGEPPFDDRRIRYAFNYLLNREKLIKELFYNEYIPKNSFYAGSIYENPANEQVKYDPEKAVQLLAEAGWKTRNEQGLLVNDQGQVLRLEIGIPKVIDYVVTPFQQMLRDYGIDLQIKFMDGNNLIGRIT
ncbi:ABC transporter substrate-binding protein [candidate division CSSED10-310 bacterium]|uniref:ABC transporter substrate-binding protein n=1 Tax=candidate division CSSED10-310 bacterium TaxID=2855610 RepID=A0ABV6YR57_UNCC1